MNSVGKEADAYLHTALQYRWRDPLFLVIRTGLTMANVSSLGSRISDHWDNARPWVYGMVIGLVAGPVISGLSGFQVRSSTAAATTHTRLVAQQASFCAGRARAASATETPLNWQQRSDLAKEWATAPDGSAAESEVMYACAAQLAG